MSYFDRALDPPPGQPWSQYRGSRFASRAEARQAMREHGIDACESCGWRLADCVHGGGDLLHVHHIVPVQVGGEYVSDNIVLLCQNCHRVAHRLFPVRRHSYHGPTGRRSFLYEMRAFGVDPERWWEHRRQDVLRGGVGTPPDLTRRRFA